ncbi:MAG TPA: hypothetical protein VI636_18915 [Candidatus Angelobacter sp.]
MKEGEIRLYLCLMHRSERYSSREVTITDDDVRKEVGAASRTLCNARKKLQELGLIQYRKVAGNKYVYVICNPATGKPYPEDPKKPIRYKKREKQEPESRPQSPVIAETAAIVEVPKAPEAPVSQKAAENRLGDDPYMTEHGLAGLFGNRDGEGNDDVPF